MEARSLPHATGWRDRVNGLWFGIVELVVGVAGIVMGMLRLTNRNSAVISLGLVIMGVGNLLHGHLTTFFVDAGGLVLLFGLGMTLSAFRRKKPKKDRS